MTVWYLIEFGTFPGVENMAIDMAMMDIARKKSIPVLRFYSWEPATLSLGRFQKLEDIDLEKVKKLGFDVVRRPSGGRAVLHYDELTYAVAFPESVVSSSVIRTYLEISKALVTGLKALEVDAVLARERSKERYTSFAACFATTSLHEVKVGGRKLIGSAQVRSNGAVLQHGSIPLKSHIEEYVESFVLSQEESQRLKFLLNKRTTCILDHVETNMNEVFKALLHGFKETFNIDFALFREKVDFERYIEDVKIC